MYCFFRLTKVDIFVGLKGELNKQRKDMDDLTYVPKNYDPKEKNLEMGDFQLNRAFRGQKISQIFYESSPNINSLTKAQQTLKRLCQTYLYVQITTSLRQNFYVCGKKLKCIFQADILICDGRLKFDRFFEVSPKKRMKPY